ncbi:MAG TPA: histidine kinase dimerization/phospho-acceptor domain-containing protein, partial [Ramlibacter sp.]|nr:histidine kinase dimerization/phospho-acceptor domain-containing protein [Ramlibacter sp.]
MQALQQPRHLLRSALRRPDEGSSAAVPALPEREKLLRRLQALELQCAQLKAAAEQSRAAQQEREEFVTRLSHDLRTPLGALMAAADVLQSVPPGSTTAAEAREIIARQSRQLSQHL